MRFASTHSIDPATGVGTPLRVGSDQRRARHAQPRPRTRRRPDRARSRDWPCRSRATDNGRTYVFRLRPGIRVLDRADRATDRCAGASIERAVRAAVELRAIFGSDCRRARLRTGGAAADLSAAGIVANDHERHRHVPPDRAGCRSSSTGSALTAAAILPASTPSREATRRRCPPPGPYRISALPPRAGDPLHPQPVLPPVVPRRAARRLSRTRSSCAQGIQQSDAAATLIERGRADLMTEPRAPHRPSTATVLHTRFPGSCAAHAALITIFAFLNTRVPPFDDVRVRRALNYRRSTAPTSSQILGGPASAQPTCQILPPQMPGLSPAIARTRSIPPPTATWDAALTCHGPGGWSPPPAPPACGSGVWGFTAPVGPWTTARARYVTSVLRQLGYRDECIYRAGRSHDRIHDGFAQPRAGHRGRLGRGVATPRRTSSAGCSCGFFIPKSPINVRRQRVLRPGNRPADSFRAYDLQPRDPARAHALWAQPGPRAHRSGPVAEHGHAEETDMTRYARA